MDGDTGVILPEGWEHPADWPQWDAQETKAPPTASQTPPPTTESRFIFLSYASDDRDRIMAYRQFFQQQGLQVWWDQDIPNGAKWREMIAEKLKTTACVLTFWTDTSTTSTAVIEEASTAQAKGKFLHIKLDDTALPFGVSETQYTDMRTWDSTAEHPDMRKLLQALRDKIDPPGKAALSQRLTQSSPIDFKLKGTKYTAVDTPQNTLPSHNNPDDLEHRLTALRILLGKVSTRVKAKEYNVPTELHTRLTEALDAANLQPPNWYCLSDTRDALTDCYHFNEGKHWNDMLKQDLARITATITKLQPLLQPAQTPITQDGAKPPETDPKVTQDDLPELHTISAEFSEILQAKEVTVVFDGFAKHVMDKQARDLSTAEALPDFTETEKKIKYQRLRHAVRGTAMVIGSFTAVVGSGVAINLLTSPEAAITLASKLQPILDALLKLF